MHNILFEPFKIKAVEPLPMSSEEDRRRWIKEVSYNVFRLRSGQVMIDLLTDSGTGAMSDQQWAAMMCADESYAGSKSFYDLEETARSIFGMEHVIPVHQGRAAEHLIFTALLEGGELVVANGLFDTTWANIKARKAEGRNLPVRQALRPFDDFPFKGNIDLQELEEVLKREGPRIPCVLMTITNNAGGGQPVSYENLKAAAEIARQHGKLVIIDACRFAENSYFIKTREKGSSHIKPEMSVHEIARKCFELADVVTFSGKKDALSNIGGLLCLRDAALAEKVKQEMLVLEGFPTYGGLAGYSLAAMSQGLKEVLDERYLEYRLRTISWMVERLEKASVPVLRPAGGHAVYLESSEFYPQIKREHFPGITLVTDLYIRAGVRCCELGGVAFGERDQDGNYILPPLDLVRLAVPRRVYTEAHMGHVVECIKEVHEARYNGRGFAFLEESKVLRHFTSTFRPL